MYLLNENRETLNLKWYFIIIKFQKMNKKLIKKWKKLFMTVKEADKILTLKHHLN